MASRSQKSPPRASPARARKPTPRRAGDLCAACAKRLRRVQAEHARELARQARQLATVRRAADRQLAAMMKEIALLRHHQARVDALERLLSERSAAAPSPVSAGASGGWTS